MSFFNWFKDEDEFDAAAEEAANDPNVQTYEDLVEKLTGRRPAATEPEDESGEDNNPS